MVSCSLSFLSEHKGSLWTGRGNRQCLLICPPRTAFPHSLCCLIPRQLGECEVKQQDGSAWERDNLSAAWVFTNRKAGLEIQNSYGNFYFSLHLKNPQPSEAQALFSVKFLAQSLKMWAVCTLEQQTCCNYLCKLSICEACFTWWGVCSSTPAGRTWAASPAWCNRDVGETSLNAGEESATLNFFFFLRAQYISTSFRSIAEKPCGTDPTLLLCFCSLHQHLIHHSGFMLTKMGN